MVADVARLEQRIDRVAASSMEVSAQLGGIDIKTQIDAMEIAKVMAAGKISIPAHLRGNPGDCWAIIMLANEWRMSPIQVANKSYSVNNRIAFEASLLQGVVLQRAPIKGRIKVEYSGEGDARACRVWAQLRDEDEQVEYTSPPFGRITPKNSPLWKTDPDQQLFYFSVRALCKRHFPDVLLGIYAKDELEDNPHYGPDNAKDVTERPSVAARLPGSKGRGFNAQHVERETRGGAIDEPNTEAQRDGTGLAPAPAPSGDEPRASERESGSPDSGAADQPQSVLQPPQPNSSRESPPPLAPETKPAPEHVQESGAGTSQSSAENHGRSAADEERQAGSEPGASALHGSTGLPDTWRKDYAAALKRVRKFPDLEKRAEEFWNQYGGWAAHKSASIRKPAIAIYDVFQNHFPDHEKRDALLRDLGAA